MISGSVRWYEDLPWEDENMLRRGLDSEACQALVSRKIFMYNTRDWETELETLWTKQHRAEASCASPWGFYVGMDSIARHYAAQDDAFGDGVGLSLMRTVNTPVVYIAADGKTAQGMWLLAGEETRILSDGAVSGLHIYGRVAVDFVREDEGWRILHWADVYNMTQKVGEDIKKTTVQDLPEEEILRPLFLAGEPDVLMNTHYPEYHGTDGWPRYPSAHESYGPMHSCGPDSHPGLNKTLQDVNWALRMAHMKAWGRTVTP